MHSWKIITATLLLVSLPPFSNGLSKQGDDRNGGQSQDHRDDHGNRNNRRRSDFNNGLRDGGRGGQYYDPRHEHDGYDERYRQNNDYYQQRQGGIGPGKGTIIRGAAGAGIGAVVGEANQNNRHRDDYNPR
jgi:hypothetical protein